MKVAYILSVSWGGIPHYTAELANAISKYADVMVFKPKDSNSRLFSKDVIVIDTFKPINLSRKCLASAFSLSNLKNFFSYKNIKLIDEVKPDIVHFTELYPYSSIFSFLYRVCRKFPTVCTLHATFKSPLHLLSIRNFLYGLLVCITEFTKYLVSPDAIIVHTREDRETLIRRGVNPDKIFLIPHGSYGFFRNIYAAESEETEENCILFFGYIIETKGIEYLIKSVPLISKEVPDVKVIIAGEGDFTRYSRLIDEPARFEVYNEFVPNEIVSKLFRRAKIVVLPYTYHRGHSGVLNIARAFGKPVIVTSVGNLPNMVRDGEDGLVVPPRDHVSLANAAIKLLKDDELRRRMGEKALERARELSWDNIARIHMKVYERVIEQRRKTTKVAA